MNVEFQLTTLDRRAIASFYGHADTLAGDELCERFIREVVGKAVDDVGIDHTASLNLNEHEGEGEGEGEEAETDEPTEPHTLETDEERLAWGRRESERRKRDLASVASATDLQSVQEKATLRRQMVGLSAGEAADLVRLAHREGA